MFLGAGGSEFSSRPFADETQATIDSEVARLLREAEQRAVEMLRQHRDVLDKLVDLLIAEETVDGSEIYALAGRPEPSGGVGLTVAPNRTVALDKPVGWTSRRSSRDRSRASGGLVGNAHDVMRPGSPASGPRSPRPLPSR